MAENQRGYNRREKKRRYKAWEKRNIGDMRRGIIEYMRGI